MAEIVGTSGNDNLSGTADADTITGLAGDDLINGGDGDDTIDGGDGNDILNGNGGVDSLNGGTGDDYLSIDFGDSADGGIGLDRILFGFQSASALNIDLSALWTGGTVSVGGGSISGIEKAAGLSGSSFDDIIVMGTGYTNDDQFQGSPGIYGGGGNDSITGGDGKDQLNGDAGDDQLFGLGNRDSLYGGAGNDLVDAGDGDDSLYLGSGNDIGLGGLGNDSLYGDTGNDQLDGGDGNDTVEGEAGDDTLFGGAGTDYLIGGTGFDHLEAGDGDDSALFTDDDYLDGGAGTDFLLMNLGSRTGPTSFDLTTLWSGGVIATGVGSIRGFEGLNSYVGSPGDDVLIVGADLAYGFTVNPSGGNDKIIAGSGNDNIYLGSGNDEVGGGAGVDEIIGNGGNDLIDGGEGNDRVYGGNGNDVLNGGAGNDLVGHPIYFYHANLEAGDDQLNGGSGNDLIYDSVGANVLHGDDGADQVIGTGQLFGDGGDDILSATGTATILHGGDGNDQLTGLYNALELYGDAGDDWFTLGGLRNSEMLADGGADTDRLNIQASPGSPEPNGSTGLAVDLSAMWAGGDGQVGFAGGPVSIVRGFETFDLLIGSPFADTVVVGEGYTKTFSYFSSDVSTGDTRLSNDAITGGGGNDVLHAGGGNDVMHGGSGDDYVEGNAGDDQLFGDAGNDQIFAGPGVDSVEGGDGNDRIYSYSPYYGSDASGDILRGGNGMDSVVGGAGNDQLFGDADEDILEGGDGNDQLTGGSGYDSLHGNAGDDLLFIDSLDVFILGGTGTDTARFTGLGGLNTALVSIEVLEVAAGANLQLTAAQFSALIPATTVLGGTGTLTLTVTPGQLFQTKLLSFAGSNLTVAVIGSSGNDIIKLGSTQHTVDAGDGIDQIKGGNAADTINGGNGGDKINGAGGADILTGGTGNDVFKYANASDSGLGAAADRITDFAIGQDRINLVNIDTNPGLAGMQGFAFAGTTTFAGTGAAEVRYQNSGGDIIVQADVNGDGAADMEIVLQGLAGQTLSASQFVLGTPPAMEPPAASSNPSTAAEAAQFGDSARGITGTYTVVNTAGIAQATIDLLTGLADEALRLWGTVLAGSANISVKLTIADIPVDRASGGWGTGFSAGTSGGFSVAVGAPAWELAFGVNSGDSTDIVLSFDPDYIANELYLDPTPGTRDNIPVDRTDGLSVMIHEIGHALGFIGYYNEATNTFSSNTKTTYDLRLSVVGSDVFFDGPNVQAVYGGPVPLTDNNYAHYGNSFGFPWSSGDPLTGLMNGVVYYRGYAYTIQDIDLAFLADTGLGTIRDDILNVPNLTRMRGGPGNDTITGSTVNNFLWGDEGNDTIYGGGGSDTIDGGSGANLLFGEAGNDRLLVSASGTSVDGGSDSDTLAISGSVASLAGLTGIETVELATGSGLTLTSAQVSTGLPSTAILTGSGSMTINMTAGVGLLTKVYNFTGFTGQFAVNGTAGTDIVKLGNVVQTVNLGDGLDTIQGGSLVDTINGGGGVDKIAGNGGADVLTGGTGNDVFKYRSGSDSGLGAAADRITDFVIGQDRINFVRIDADAATMGDQAFAFVGTATFTNTGTGQLRYLTSGSDLIVQADVNGDGTADMEIVLQGLAGQTLSGTDFVL